MHAREVSGKAEIKFYIVNHAKMVKWEFKIFKKHLQLTPVDQIPPIYNCIALVKCNSHMNCNIWMDYAFKQY